MRCEQLKSYNKKNPNNLSRFPQLSYSKYHQAGQKVQQRSHFYAKKKFFTFSAGGDQFSRCDHFRLRPPPLRRAAGRSSSFHPKWFKGNDSFFLATKKAESVKRRSILKPKSKGKVFLWNNGRDRTQTRQELPPNRRTTCWFFSSEAEKKMVCSEIQIQNM